MMENTNIILASSKNAKKILSKKKINSNSLKREEKNTKKKDDSNFRSTAFNQLIIHHGAEKVVVTIRKSNLEESNKLDFCLKGLLKGLRGTIISIRQGN